MGCHSQHTHRHSTQDSVRGGLKELIAEELGPRADKGEVPIEISSALVVGGPVILPHRPFGVFADKPGALSDRTWND